MFANQSALKSNRAHAYRIFMQTSLRPADSTDSREQSIRMIQAQPNTCAKLVSNLEWQSRRFILANDSISRKRRWRQYFGDLLR